LESFDRVGYASRARSRIANHYSWDRIADQYEELFSTLISLGPIDKK